MSKSTVELRSGEKMPLFAVGTLLGSPREIGILVDFALTMGLRHFDVVAAPEIETTVGQVLSNWLLSGRIRRQEIFVTAKLPPHAMKSTRVKRFLLKSLLNLGLNYVDSYVISSPIACKEPFDGQPVATKDRANLPEIWAAMEEVEEEGLARALGVAHFSLQQIQKIRDSGKVKPQIVQMEFHPFLQEKSLVDFCKANKIQIVAVVPPIFTDHQTVKYQNYLLLMLLLRY
uniref:NADP-dependent oxidoreductase domain-containing protein n=1 Tax=Strigamia maritima TaxID=126957 RepID=T1JGS8_STRMM